jgi:hypothetical protein
MMRINRLQSALAKLAEAMREVDAALNELARERDPLASHIFVSRRDYRKTEDTTKSTRRHDMEARQSWLVAQHEFGFRGSLDEWERLLDAPMKR